jgi:lysophospholipase L1-like esterase
VAENVARRPDADESASPLLAGDVMIALGDSITAGIGAGHVSEGCMWLLADRLRHLRPDLELVFLAVPSESSASMLQPGGQLDRAETAIRDAVSAGRRVCPITVSVGGNDIMEASLIGDDAALQQLEENLGVILRRLDAALRAGGQRVDDACIVQTVYNPFESLPPDSADLMAPRRASRSGFNAAIRRVAQNLGVRVCDVASLFRGRTLELTWVRTGDIHPTGAGHELIAEEYLRVGGWTVPAGGGSA